MLLGRLWDHFGGCAVKGLFRARLFGTTLADCCAAQDYSGLLGKLWLMCYGRATQDYYSGLLWVHCGGCAVEGPVWVSLGPLWWTCSGPTLVDVLWKT